MQIHSILLLLLSLGLVGCLVGCLVDSPSRVLEPVKPATDQMEITTIQQIILKPAAVNAIGANGELTISYVESLNQAANAKVVYVRPMFGGAHVLRFEQPLAESTAMNVFSTWKQRGLVEYAEVDGIVRIAPH